MIDTARDGEGLTIDELIYRAAQLDPHPGEWTFPIFIKRAFGSLMPDRYFYELITQFSDLLHIARLNLRLLDAGVPQNFIQGMQAVIQVFPSMWDAPEGRLPLPDADEACLGCHSVAINGWTDDGLIFQNSYGPGWGNNGSGVLTRQYADLFLREAWTSRVGSCGANPYNWHTLMAATGLDLARSWCSSEIASLGRIREGGRKFDYRHYAIVSLGSGCLVQVIEACRRGANKREGWAHLYHFSDEGRHQPVLRELFVVPEARRQGIGTVLDRLATDGAMAGEADALQLDLHEADAYGSAKKAARAFATHRRYEWTDGGTTHPAIHSCAYKFWRKARPKRTVAGRRRGRRGG